MLFNLESALTVLSQKSHEVAAAAEETKKMRARDGHRYGLIAQVVRARA